MSQGIILSSKLPWVRFLARRYLSSKKGSKFLSFITVISILGVIVGVTAMGVVLSVMEGFEGELKKRLMATDLHILVTPTAQTEGFDQGVVPEASLKLDPRLLSQLGGKLWPTLQTEAILRTGRKITGVVAKGINDDRLDQLKKQITESAESELLSDRQGPDPLPPAKIWVGKEMAYEMNMIPGDYITLISPTETEGPMSSVPRLKRFVVAGVYNSGMPEQELHTVFMEQQSLRSFLRRTGGVTQWEASLKDFDQAPALRAELQAALPTFKVQDWQSMNSSLFFSLKLERVAMFIALSFIVLVASFNIITTLTLMVLEKKKEIAILKTMGATNEQVAGVFFTEGIFIGGVGIVGGLLLALLLCGILKKYEFITLPDIYYDRTLPVIIKPLYFALISASAFAIVLMASIIPSRKAARVDPLKGIRQA